MITLRNFASLRETLGTGEERIPLADAAGDGIARFPPVTGGWCT